MTEISCRITPDYFPGVTPLCLIIRLNGEILLNQAITEAVYFTHSIIDDEAHHCLEFEMYNKTFAHSPWDNQLKTITADCTLKIENMQFDGIDLTQVFTKVARYQHRRNIPDGDLVTEDFYDVMGCNGVVRFEFDSPTYLWLLENM